MIGFTDACGHRYIRNWGLPMYVSYRVVMKNE